MVLYILNLELSCYILQWDSCLINYNTRIDCLLERIDSFAKKNEMNRFKVLESRNWPSTSPGPSHSQPTNRPISSRKFSTTQEINVGTGWIKYRKEGRKGQTRKAVASKHLKTLTECGSEFWSQSRLKILTLLQILRFIAWAALLASVPYIQPIKRQCRQLR